jgi:hypothetical protein
MRALIALTLALGACATEGGSDDGRADGADATDPLAGMTAGPPRQCLQSRQIRHTTVLTGREALVFEGHDGTRWLNVPRGGCAGLRGDVTVVNERDPLCAGDIVRLLGPGGLDAGSCVAAEFVPYRSR